MHRAAKGSRRLDLGKLALSLFLNLCSRREHHLNAFQNRDPVTFRKRLESEETFQSKLSVLRIPHPNAGALQVGQNGHTARPEFE